MNKRVERIKKEIPITNVLSNYGYDIYTSGSEQQFKCDLHGDGSDNAPSARVYPHTSTWFCFACGKVRDAVSTVMEKEGLPFSEACKALEIKYNLKVWEHTPKNLNTYEEKEVSKNIELKKKTHDKLVRMTKERECDLNRIIRFWDAYDFLCFLENVDEEQWVKLYSKIKVYDG
jgi:DNA primase